MIRFSTTRAALALLAGTIIAGNGRAGAQAPAVAAARLEIRRDSAPPMVLTAADLAKLAHVDVAASEHGRAGTFAAIPLAALLRQAGVPIDSVRGARTTWYVVATASDGYRALFSLAELAPDLGGRAVFVADRRGGQSMSAADGPLRLIVPDDKRPTRWVRQLITITIRHAEP